MSTPTVSLASTNPIKRAAVAAFFNVPSSAVHCVPCDSLNLPPQPVNSAKACARARMQHLRDQVGDCGPGHYLVAVENGLRESSLWGVGDVCHVVVQHANEPARFATSMTVPVDGSFYNKAKMLHDPRAKYAFNGLSVTVGSIIHATEPDIAADDWLVNFGGMYANRKQQIIAALHRALPGGAFDRNVLLSRVGKDVSPLMADSEDFGLLIQLIIMEADQFNFNKVVGLEVRGSIFGAALAANKHTGFVTDKGVTEYIQKGDQVIVCDDLVSTAGSLKAVCDLVTGSGGEVAACIVVLAMNSSLGQARSVLGDIPLIVLLPDYVEA